MVRTTASFGTLRLNFSTSPDPKHQAFPDVAVYIRISVLSPAQDAIKEIELASVPSYIHVWEPTVVFRLQVFSPHATYQLGELCTREPEGFCSPG